MKPEEEDKFYVLLAKTIEVNWERDFPSDRMRIWWMILREYSFQQVGDAIARYIKQGEAYWPQVSDIVRTISEMGRDRAEIYPLLEHKENYTKISSERLKQILQPLYEKWGMRPQESKEEKEERWIKKREELKRQSELIQTAKAVERPLSGLKLPVEETDGEPAIHVTPEGLLGLLPKKETS